MHDSSSVPFSPVHGHPVEVRHFYGDGQSFTYTATPLREMWQDAYRSAALAISFKLPGDTIPEDARRLARLGVALEDAYLKRVRDEARDGR